ncbi:MAG TPA: hypothetical protein VFE13_00660 [Caulobacteraceae bacterium]|jgi:hypothetical protein|nr:hypothetical protein [Caulobacteraceae bacterium]
MRTALIVLGLAAAALGACSKPAGRGDAAAATAPPTTPITTAQLPAPTKGLWARSGSQDGGAPTKGSKCMDGKPIDPLDRMPMTCQKMAVGRTATGGFVVDAECAGAQLHLAGEGDFKKSFTTDASMTRAAPPAANAAASPPTITRNHSDWTYVSPDCPAPP